MKYIIAIILALSFTNLSAQDSHVINTDGTITVVDSAKVKARQRAQIHKLKVDSTALSTKLDQIEDFIDAEGIDASGLYIPALDEYKRVLTDLGVDEAIISDLDDRFTPSGLQLLPPADGKIVSDNFQDGRGNAPFNLQVRNTTREPVTQWQAVIKGVRYKEIPELSIGEYELKTLSNDDDSYTHVFSGKGLAPFQGIVIRGGLPNPQGTNSGLSLYCSFE